MDAVDPWIEIQRNAGYSPTFIQRVRLERVAKMSATLKQMEHDRAVEILCKNRAPKWVQETILAVASEHSVSPADIMTGGRTYPVVDARHAAIYAVKALKRELSSPTIGRWFGIDHTSVLNALATHAYKTGAESLTNYRLRARYGYRAADYAPVDLPSLQER